MVNRLDEIDKECGKGGPWVHTVGGCTFTFDEPPRDIADKRWLVARIRAMEDVIVALEEYHDAFFRTEDVTAPRLWKERWPTLVAALAKYRGMV